MRPITKLITARGTLFIVQGYADATVDCTWANLIVPALSDEDEPCYNVYLPTSGDLIEIYDAVEIHRTRGD